MVRDQVGQTVTAEGSEVILLKGGVEVGRTPITSNRLDQSYELNMRIDQNRSGTAFYTEKAVAAGGLFSLVVSMNGALIYPIEVSGNLTAGKGGERVNLDRTLGENDDGLRKNLGCHAGDATERFNLQIKERKAETIVRFEAYAITAKVYTIESLPDMKRWMCGGLAVAAPGTADRAYRILRRGCSDGNLCGVFSRLPIGPLFRNWGN
jgi:hypothetical protein